MNKPQLTPPTNSPRPRSRPQTAARSATTAPRRNASHPGDYLLRLRLQYGHKGTRPLARIV